MDREKEKGIRWEKRKNESMKDCWRKNLENERKSTKRETFRRSARPGQASLVGLG